MTISTKGKKIYFDANFLIYWFISKKPELKKRARVLLAEFLSNKDNLYSSTLAFDEAWWGIRNEYNQQNNVNLSCYDDLVFDELKKFTDAFLPKLKLAQFTNANNGIMAAMNHIKNFKLRPRDAFHLAIVEDNNIEVLVTGDKHFIENENLTDIIVQSVF